MALSKIQSNSIVDGGIQEVDIDSTYSNFLKTNRKNFIINGDMRIDQRNGGAPVVGVGASEYIIDRWNIAHSSDGSVTAQQAGSSPTPVEAGHSNVNSLLLDITTADASIGATQYLTANQYIEGYNIASMGFGKAGTRKMTLSFWHRHTKTGIYSVGMRNHASSRSYAMEYTQSVSNTWEKAVLTFDVDTSGVWAIDNTRGLGLVFAAAVGTTYQAPSNDTWLDGNYFASANQVNAMDNPANEFRITLVQLEAGDQATEFDWRPYPEELALCQRYYQRINATGAYHSFANGLAWSTATNTMIVFVPHPVAMRSIPTFNNSGASGFGVDPGNKTVSALSLYNHNDMVSTVRITASSGYNASDAIQLIDRDATPSCWISFDAEL